MEKKKFSIQTKVVIGLIIALIWFWVGLLFYKLQQFRLVQTNPSVGNVATVSPFMDIEYNKPLSSNVRVTTTSKIIESVQIQGDEIHILFYIPLQLSTYSINVSNISDTAGQTLKDETFVFTPKIMTNSQLPSDQQAALQSIQLEYAKKVQGDPLIRFLPFTGGGNEFKITYSISGQGSNIQITVTITAANQQGFNDAITWIKEIGANPNNYHIVYVTAKVGS